MDGIKNHLWAALKTAVQGWFNDKVEELLGLGKSVWNLLTKGGIALAQVGKMVWEGLKAAIPPALIAMLVERLVAMIVPAAGAIMAIIQRPAGRLGRDPAHHGRDRPLRRLPEGRQVRQRRPRLRHTRSPPPPSR